MSQSLLLLGASVRALASSAMRAGFAPRCIDLFADSDLCQVCPVRQLTGRYPQSFLAAIEEEQPAPWLYTGGLENWPGLVEQLAQRHPLWGNMADVLRAVRDPWNVTRLLRGNRLPVLRLARRRPLATDIRWLVKPLRGAGGSGIAFADSQWLSKRPGKVVYYQEHAPGDAVAAIFVGDGRTARLLGMSRQLVGEVSVCAAPFRYCGSVGPLELPGPLREGMESVGKALVAGCRLKGLFGVDGIVRGGQFWTVEVNPRYTASVEVLEYATGLQAVAEHAAVFNGQPVAGGRIGSVKGVVGKAVLFSRLPVTFPKAGPWFSVRSDPSSGILPAFADIPAPGEPIEAGRPILTFFTQGQNCEEVLAGLQSQAGELERSLYL